MSTAPADLSPPAPRGRPWILLGLVGIALLAFALRALGFEWVFVGDRVVFPPADPQYHLRRAFWGFEHFPRVLLFDPYLNYPGGAPVPWPPLFDFLMALVARVLAHGQAGFERVAAWLPPVLGALGTVPVFLAARRAARHAGVVRPAIAGLLAAFGFAWLPVAVSYSRVGNVDHHALVAFVGACLLATVVRFVDPEEDAGRRLHSALALFAVRTALLLTWHGSLLYLALADGYLLVLGALRGDRERSRAHALGAFATGIVLLPLVLMSPVPLGGPFSAIALSWLHVCGVLGIGVVALAPVVLESQREGCGPMLRLGSMVVAGLAFLGLVFAMPGPREGLAPAFEFLSMRDGVGRVTGEQTPLFAFLGGSGRRGTPPSHQWGAFAYLVPVLPIAGIWAGLRARRAGGEPASALAVALFTVYFGTLNLTQIRYGNDLAPAGAVSLGLGLALLGDAVAARVGWRASALRTLALGAVVMLAAMIVPIRVLYAPRLSGTLDHLIRPDAAPERDRATPSGSLDRFLRTVERVTPETGGFLSAERFEPVPPDRVVLPQYGVLAPANLGHAIQYRARRATATDPFWAYIGPENWALSHAFLAARDEARALELARRLRGRYVITSGEARPGTVFEQLHRVRGTWDAGRPALGHFRHLIEGPEGGRGVGAIFDARTDRAHVPYRLFEIVEGALLDVRAAPGQRVAVELDLVTPTGRSFRWRAYSATDARGVAEIRVPYPSASSGGADVTRAQGMYRIEVQGERHRVDIGEAAVEEGYRVPISFASMPSS